MLIADDMQIGRDNIIRNKSVILIAILLCLFCNKIYAQQLINNSDFISKAQANEAKITAPYKEDVANLSSQAVRNAQNPQIQNYVQSLISSNSSYPNLSPQDKSNRKILIFVSSSMPEVSLQQWYNQALKINSPIIIRGLIDNSMGATQSWVKVFMDDANGKGGIQIDPVAFELYGIKQVPAVVITQQSPACYGNQHCIAPPFDVVYGNVNITEALQTIAEKGEVGKQIALLALHDLGVNHA